LRDQLRDLALVGMIRAAPLFILIVLALCMDRGRSLTMRSFRRDPEGQGLDHSNAAQERLEEAQRIALESLKEDHHALEVDARLAFSPAAMLAEQATANPL